MLQARVEEVGQALLRRVQDVQGLGPRRKGKRNQYHMDAYEEHMLLSEASHAIKDAMIHINWVRHQHMLTLEASQSNMPSTQKSG